MEVIAKRSAVDKRSSKLVQFIRSREAGVLLALIALIVFFAIATPKFLTTLNILNVLRQISVLGIVAVAMSMLIIAGEFDLSVGSTYAVVAMVVAILAEGGMNIWLASVLGLALGSVMGLANGLLTVKAKIPSFIVTMGSMMVYRGVALLVSKGMPRTLYLEGFFYQITGATLPGGIPAPIIWFIVAGVVGYYILHVSRHGFKILATGGNAEAARLAGIKTDWIKAAGFVMTGFAAGLAGIVSASYLGSVTPTQGQGMELQAIAASVIGGTSLNGGIGSTTGVLMGALIMGIVRNGLVLLGTSAYTQDLILGLVLIVAVLIGSFSSREKR